MNGQQADGSCEPPVVWHIYRECVKKKLMGKLSDKCDEQFGWLNINKSETLIITTIITW